MFLLVDFVLYSVLLVCWISLLGELCLLLSVMLMLMLM